MSTNCQKKTKDVSGRHSSGHIFPFLFLSRVSFERHARKRKGKERTLVAAFRRLATVLSFPARLIRAARRENVMSLRPATVRRTWTSHFLTISVAGSVLRSRFFHEDITFSSSIKCLCQPATSSRRTNDSLPHLLAVLCARRWKRKSFVIAGKSSLSPVNQRGLEPSD